MKKDKLLHKNVKFRSNIRKKACPTIGARPLCKRFYFLFAHFTTKPESATRAITLGITINWIKHISKLPHKVVGKAGTEEYNATAMTEYTAVAFLPNRYSTLILPNIFQPRIVENAKNKRQIATNELPAAAAEYA